MRRKCSRQLSPEFLASFERMMRLAAGAGENEPFEFTINFSKTGCPECLEVYEGEDGDPCPNCARE
jgi:hypothetical protein